MCESFFATLECELRERRTLRAQAEAKMAVYEFIEGWYNPHRRHSALGYESPMSFERLHREDRVETWVASDSTPALEKPALEDAPCREISTGPDLQVGVESTPEATRNAGGADRKIPLEGVGEENRPEA